MDKLKVYNDLKESLDIYIDEDMKKHTSFKTGGTADILVKPRNIDEIEEILNYCKINNIEYIVIGNGTNLLVKDNGVRELLIKISNNFNSYEIIANKIVAKAGCPIIKLSNIAYENGLGGLEFACGIPGTLGGAIKMNAGAFKGEMNDIVTNVKYLDNYGNIYEVDKSNLRFEYRSSMFDDIDDCVILEATLELKEKNKDEIKERMDYCTNYRREKQPLNYPSAGSTFKRPEGHFPGQLIEECGLKGYSIGGAEVSELHANFVINKGNATSADILNLMEYIEQKVYEKFNVELEREIKIIGE